MNKIILEEKRALECIKDFLNSSRCGFTTVNNAKFHHNTGYKEAASICQYGILTLLEIKKLGIKNYSNEQLLCMSDIESHINGIDKVSLSVTDLDDLYSDEMEYNPYSSNEVDFLVSNDITARRSTLNYGNEFLSNSISREKIRSIDIRLLQLINNYEKNNHYYNISISKIIENYNHLKNIAISMKKFNLDIPFREMSNANASMNIDKISSMPKLVLKDNLNNIKDSKKS